jgi:hypothetical protein
MRVDPLMLRRVDQAQILNPIIRFVVVDVMHMLITGQRAIKVLLHYIAVLKNALIRPNGQPDISIRAKVAATLPPNAAFVMPMTMSAVARTEQSAPACDVGFVGEEGVPAMLARTTNCGWRGTIGAHRNLTSGGPGSVDALPRRSHFTFPIIPFQSHKHQRNRFEYHPENQPPNDVQLTRYGAAAAKAAGYSGPGI